MSKWKFKNVIPSSYQVLNEFPSYQSVYVFQPLSAMYSVSLSKVYGTFSRHGNGLWHVCHRLWVSSLSPSSPWLLQTMFCKLTSWDLRTSLVLVWKRCPGKVFLWKEFIINPCLFMTKETNTNAAFTERLKGWQTKYFLSFETLIHFTDNVLMQNNKICFCPWRTNLLHF